MRNLDRNKKRVGLIYCPDYLIVNGLFFPPYALSVYQRQLSEAGYEVENIDLSFQVLKHPELRELHSQICTSLQKELDDIDHENNLEIYSAARDDSGVRKLIDVFLRELEEYDLDYHCFSIMHTPLIYALAIIAAAKHKFGKPIIVGGAGDPSAKG